MAVDVSGLTSMLAASPGQNMVNLQNTLEQAYQDRQAADQRQFQNEMLSQKAHLDQQVAQGKLNMQQLDIAAKQGQFAASWAQSLDTAQDPLHKQALVQQGLAQAQQLGFPPEGIAVMQKAAQDPAIARSLIARGVSTNEYYKSALAGTKSVEPSTAEKQYNELVQRAKDNGTYVPGVTEKVSEGIAYKSYHHNVDPTTGNLIITDDRSMGGGRVPASEAAQVTAMGGVKADSNYNPKVITTGNKQEMKLQDRVQDLSKDIKQSGIIPAEVALQPIEATLSNTFDKGKPIPGYGRIESGLPPVALTWWDEEGKTFRQQVQNLMNIDIHQFAGSAQSAQELARIQQKYAAGFLNDPKQLVSAIRQFRAAIEESKKATFGGYDPSVKERYWNQGGITFQGGQKQGEAIPAPTPKANIPTSAAQVRADAKKYGWNEDQIQATLKRFNLKDQ